MAQEADIKILLIAPLDERVRRIVDRESREYEEVKEETIVRERSEKERYMEVYNIDVDDYSVYDLVLDTGKFNEEEMIELLTLSIELVSG